MTANSFLVEVGGLALDDLDRALRTIAQACAQTIAVVIAQKTGLAVDDLDGSLGAGGNALAAAVAQFLVDLDDLPY
jgi:hypothetical protein